VRKKKPKAKVKKDPVDFKAKIEEMKREHNKALMAVLEEE